MLICACHRSAAWNAFWTGGDSACLRAFTLPFSRIWNLRYRQSGLATLATTLRAEGGASGIGQLQFQEQLRLKIPFSAARYSFCSRSSWVTEPVTYASNHFLFLMPTAYLRLRRRAV